METPSMATLISDFAISGLTAALILSLALNVAIATGILTRMGGAKLPESIVKAGASFAGTALLLIAAVTLIRT